MPDNPVTRGRLLRNGEPVADAATAGVLDPKTRSLHVEIDLPNADGKLLAGMHANVILTPKTAEP